MNASAALAASALTTSTGEAVTFWILGAVALVGALGVVCASKAVYSALFLATTMIVLAVFYVAQGAVFLGVVQIVVYTGAVMMLFLFVLMLIGVDSAATIGETMRGHRATSVLLGIGFGALLCGGIGVATVAVTSGTSTAPGAASASRSDDGIHTIAETVFVNYLWAFELTGALLITATLGAMVLAHHERFTPRRSQRELSVERFARGTDMTPLPTPGVFARHNAVDVAALLPDGSESDLSVNAILRVGEAPARLGESAEPPASGTSEPGGKR